SCDNGGGGSKRQEVKQLIQRLKRTNPHIESNIFNSIHKVNLNTVIGYTQNGVEHSFLDGYDERATGQGEEDGKG
ncbi:MAG: tRNA 2-thiocytidine biosynthesis protein TtcA, partial [Oscillospiraceae bacterium]